MGFAKSIINAVLLHHLHRFCFQSWESFRTVQRRGKNNFSHINSTTSYEVGLDVEKSERAYFWVLFCLLCFYAYSCRQDIFIFFFRWKYCHTLNIFFELKRSDKHYETCLSQHEGKLSSDPCAYQKSNRLHSCLCCRCMWWNEEGFFIKVFHHRRQIWHETYNCY